MYKETNDELRAKKTVHKLIVAMKKHRSLFDGIREKTGLGHSAHRILMILADKGALSQTYLAEQLEISTAAVAVMLKKMECEGYIIRKADENDSRFNLVYLTEKGEEIIVISKKSFYAIDYALFKGFDNSEFEQLNIYLDRLINNIEEFEKGENS